MNEQFEESLVKTEQDPLIRYLKHFVALSVKLLAFLSVLVLFWGLIDVVVHLYQNFFLLPSGAFDSEKLLMTLGTFLAVLIVVEIFLNIVFYLKKDAVHVPLVLATALTAVARKVIILDYSIVDPLILFGIASIIGACGIVFWLVTTKN